MLPLWAEWPEAHCGIDHLGLNPSPASPQDVNWASSSLWVSLGLLHLSGRSDDNSACLTEGKMNRDEPDE